MKTLFVVLLLAAPMAPVAMAGQQRPQFTFSASAAQEIVQSTNGAIHDRLTGPTFAGEGNLTTDKIWLRVRYAQGRVLAKDEDGTARFTRDVVDGEVLAGFRAMPWLTVWAGPNARAYTLGDKTQRWLFWTAGATGRGTLIPGRLQTFVELWGALTGSITEPASKASGRGADGGLEMRLSSASPFWGRLSYRIESGHAADMRETVEALTLSLVYGFPQ
jgi:hypothetical protein